MEDATDETMSMGDRVMMEGMMMDNETTVAPGMMMNGTMMENGTMIDHEGMGHEGHEDNGQTGFDPTLGSGAGGGGHEGHMGNEGNEGHDGHVGHMGHVGDGNAGSDNAALGDGGHVHGGGDSNGFCTGGMGMVM